MTEAARKLSPQSVLGAPRRPVTRYRPWVIALIAGGLVALVGLGFAVGFGSGRSPPADGAGPPPPEAAPGPPEIDPRLPASYDDPLALRTQAPADPQLEPTPAGAPGPAGTGAASAGPSPAEVQRLEEARMARASTPFFGGAGRADPVPASGLAAAPSPAAATGSGAGPGASPASFADRAAGAPNVVPHLPVPPLSRFEIKAGAIIPAALLTGLDSDLPGPVIAQVTEPVFDHVSGRQALIPQGARLIGRYDSQVGYGQNRIMVVWTRIVFPDGRSLDIGAMTAADATGAVGLSDVVDTHAPALARAVGLSTLISMGAAAAQNSMARGSDNMVLQDGIGGLAASASETGQRIVERDLRRAPTLRVRPGWRVELIVDKDLVLPQ